MIENLPDKLCTWLSKQNEYQIYLNTVIYAKFIVIGFLIGMCFIANTVILQLGYVPDGLESTVREVTIACVIIYAICIGLIICLESKLS